MKLKDFAKNINDYVKDGYGNLEVIYSSDEEGNSFHPIFQPPTLGFFDTDWNEFFTQDQGELDESLNSICIN